MSGEIGVAFLLGSWVGLSLGMWNANQWRTLTFEFKEKLDAARAQLPQPPREDEAGERGKP